MQIKAHNYPCKKCVPVGLGGSTFTIVGRPKHPSARNPPMVCAQQRQTDNKKGEMQVRATFKWGHMQKEE